MTFFITMLVMTFFLLVDSKTEKFVMFVLHLLHLSSLVFYEVFSEKFVPSGFYALLPDAMPLKQLMFGYIGGIAAYGLIKILMSLNPVNHTPKSL